MQDVVLYGTNKGVNIVIFMFTVLKKIKSKINGDVVPIIKMCFYNTVCKAYIKMFGRNDRRNMKYKLSFCLIFKNEGPFLKEWLDYHIVVGVDHFYLYNNNSDDNFREVLEPYIKDGIVTLIEWPYECSQFKAYRHCYENFRNETNWLSFIDADEFFVPKKELTIPDWLVGFNKYPARNIHWLMFCTGGVLNHDYNKNVIEQYRYCWEDFWNHGKCLINTQYDIANFDTWHVHHHTYMRYNIFGMSIVLPAVNQFGYICTIDKTWGGGKNKRSNSTIQINHYFTKAWSIWSAKMKKTDVLFANNPKSDINYFYNYEMRNTSSDYTINRFFIKMKLKQGLIK